MYKQKPSIQTRSLCVAIYLVLTLVWLLGTFAPAAPAAGEYVPPDVGLPDRRESGGARFLVEGRSLDFWQINWQDVTENFH